VENEVVISVYHRDSPSLYLPLISKDARFVVWPGIGAWTANMNYVVMESGEANTPHVHKESEDTIFILEGKGTIKDLDQNLSLPFQAGDAIHVPIGVRHAVCADLGSRVVSVGGPAPADIHLLKAVGALPKDAAMPSALKK